MPNWYSDIIACGKGSKLFEAFNIDSYTSLCDKYKSLPNVDKRNYASMDDYVAKHGGPKLEHLNRCYMKLVEEINARLISTELPERLPIDLLIQKDAVLEFRGGAPCAGARILQEKKTSQEETSPRVIFVYISKRRPEPLLPLGGAYCRSGVRRPGDTTGSARKIISWMSLHRRNPVCFIQEAWNDSGETTISPFLYAERKL